MYWSVEENVTTGSKVQGPNPVFPYEQWSVLAATIDRNYHR